MRAQVTRVGEAWEYLEKNVLAGTTPPGQAVPFKERGLKKEWLDWMQEEHKLLLDALEQALAEKVSVFRGQSSIITKLKRWDYVGVFRRDVTVPNCGFEKDTKIMQKRVDLLLDAYNRLSPVNSELKLD
jgi:hypothetical protein